MKSHRGGRGAGVAVCVLLLAAQRALAVGVSPYLPLNLEPEIERQIERLLILGDEPILKRPIPTATVMAALPKACLIDAELCERVRAYLQRYMGDSGVTHASATAAIGHGADTVLPNERGLTTRDHWEVSAEGYVQPSDYLLANVGGIAYSKRAVPTGTVLSLGWDAAQLDIGWRDHWMSPLTDSTMLPGTEAPTTPGITLSNFRPLTRLGIQYEFFLTRLSEQAISYDGIHPGRPRLAGFELSIQPFPGWSVGVNRVLEYGGSPTLPGSAHFLLDDFFKPSGANQNLGNQQASYVSRFVFPGRTPFAIYAEYAGEDNSDGGTELLGNAALSVGVDFPRLWKQFDATLEVSEWQDIWYVHNLFLSGMSNDGLVLGNWGADQRVFGDGVGARSAMARIGWSQADGGYLEERVRTLVNQNYYGGDNRTYVGIPPYPYHHYYDLTVTYSRPVGSFTMGGDVFVGKDIFGQRFSRLDGFVRFSPSGHHRFADSDSDSDGGTKPPLIEGGEVFVDMGINASSVRTNVEPNLADTTSKWAPGPHLGIGARRAVSENNDLGARLELDAVGGRTLIGFRALDWRYRFGEKFAVSAFAGPVDWEQKTPALQLFAGVGAQVRNVVPGWDVGVDGRYGQNLARDHELPSDVQGPRAETFYKISSVLLSISRHF